MALATSLGLLTVVPTPARAQSAQPILRAGENRPIGDDSQILRGRDAPGLAVNPADPRHVVESAVDPRSGQCHYNVSFNGGDTWTGGTLTAPLDFGGTLPCQQFNQGGYLRMDGGIAFGSGQNVYIAFDATRPGAGDSVLVARSTDGGRTFAQAQVVITGGAVREPYHIRPKLGVERRNGGDRVVVEAWGLTQQGPATFEGQQRRIVVAVSENNGVTWGTPVDAQPADQAAREISPPVIAPGGAIYLAWRTQRNTANGFPAGALNDDYLSKSTDGGRTWTNTVVKRLAASSGANHPRIAVDARNGTLYYVDNEAKTTGNPDVWLSRSTDGGVTWSEEVRVNDDPAGPTVSQNTVNIAVAPNGRVDVIWSDRRHSYAGTGYADTFMASSSDGGRTFGPNARLTDRLTNLSTGILGPVGTTAFFAPALTPLGNDEVLVAWADSRPANFEFDNQDIYSSKVRVNPTGPPPSQQVPLGQPAAVSAALSRLAYPGGSEKFASGAPVTGTRVVVVNDADVGAALAGNVLARANLGPVLASPSSGLPPDVSAAVSRLQPGGAYLVGNDEALSPTVVSDLVSAGVPADQVFRLAGTSPADTARIVATVFAEIEQGATPVRPIPKTAVIVDPLSREAASASAMAAALRYPVLFAERDSLPGATTAALAALETTDTLVIGGPGTVADTVLRQLPNAIRVGGADLYGTARAVAAEAANRGLPTNIAYVVDGERPIDGALAGAAVARLGGALVLAPGADPAAAGNAVDRAVVVRSFSAPGPGYRLVSRDGGVFAFGGAKFLGSAGALRLAQPVVGTASTPDGGGYWLVASDGGVFAFGNAAFHGSTGAVRLNRPIVGMASTPSGKGYFLVASDGGVFAFGDAVFRGSTGAIRLNQPIVSMTTTPSGNGYFLVASDGGVFAFGDAVFRGSTGAVRLNRPIVSAAATPTGRGYLLVASDGGVFAFGDAVFRGSTGAIRLNRPIVAMTTTASAGGYYLIASDGGVFAFGAAPFFGSTGALNLPQPIVGAGG